MIRQFLENESGAVTTDYVVLTAGLVGVGIAASGSISVGIEDMTNDITSALSRDLTLVSRFDINRIGNASFEDIAGMIEAGWGLYNADGSVAEWSNISSFQAELVPSGQYGVLAANGEWMLDLEASPGNITLGQSINGAVEGQVYTATFSAADPIGNNGVEVIWGGEVIQTITPNGGSMQNYAIELVGGAGNGDNMFYLRGTGPRDNVGAFIDNVNITS